ncbi:hypothetical protein CC2G_002666 [Coprinopsis cinerea AmutBmut pab1-1]|nr:hypothetical protein CC2G_002666 [Coprinopsis cinerea AmutBmut pab1-1]
MHQSLNTWLADHLHTPKARGIEEDPSRTHQLRRAIPIEAALEDTSTRARVYDALRKMGVALRSVFLDKADEGGGGPSRRKGWEDNPRRKTRNLL